ncbi:helix-turn-helix domain-containing protein [Dapis sp. BLCC M126]
MFEKAYKFRFYPTKQQENLLGPKTSRY